jgi:hypothetical protein
MNFDKHICTLKKLHFEGLLLGMPTRNSDCWQGINMNPEGSAVNQLDGFPWFFSVLEQMLSLYPKSTLQHPFKINFKIPFQTQPS